MSANLPEPDQAAKRRSHAIEERLRGEIALGGGFLGFERFMELALYAPGLGYYMQAASPLGTAGDFVTAPELSPLFGACVARALADLLAQCPGAELLECGAGTGRLAAQVLAALDAEEQLPERYLILELSGARRAEQRATLQALVPQWLDRVHWLDCLPPPGGRRVIFANELLDALPVQLFEVAADGVHERGVELRDGRLAWGRRPLADPSLRELVAAHGLPAGYRSERCRAAGGWLCSVAAGLDAGALLLIDYGFPAHERYHPQRTAGSLRCHYRHRLGDDPLWWPGVQDLTADVDFSALAAAGTDAGLDLLGFADQASFLIDCGFSERLQALQGDPGTALDAAAAARLLLLPDQLGERVKVMAFGRGLQAPPSGFARDQRHRL